MDLPWLNNIERPCTPKRIPSVPTETALIARLPYGTGTRLMEGLRLRVKGVDFDRHVIIARQAKGNKSPLGAKFFI